MNAKRKLIEVALPLEAINAAARAEKAVPKKGHPATLHLWWSRKPLGVARAMLFAALVDDPSSDPDRWPTEDAQAAERHRLFGLVGKLGVWDQREEVLEQARAELRKTFGDRLPLVVDPFCGGGAIPLEAQRLGLPVVAIDLNPVAALITRSMIEVPQRFADLAPVHPEPASLVASTGQGFTGLVADVQWYGAAVENRAKELLGDLFASLPSPYSPSGTTQAVSYLWTRTVLCQNPACGRATPLLSTWWLSKKKSNPWHVQPYFQSDGRLDFAVREGSPPDGLRDLKTGRGASYRCVHCGEVNSTKHIQSIGRSSGFGLRLVAIQAFRDPDRPRSGRVYLDPDQAVEEAALAARPVTDLELFLDHPIPEVSGNISTFGLTRFRDLLHPRQVATMSAFAEAIREVGTWIEKDASAAGLSADGIRLRDGGTGATAYSDAIRSYLGLTLSRMANRVSMMTIHNRANGSVEQSFVQPAYAFYGEAPEANPFSGSTGSWSNALGYVAAGIEGLPPKGPAGRVFARSFLADLPAELPGSIISTDPPYYDMFDYSALSNLFYIWLRASLGDVWPQDTAAVLAPTDEQVVSNPARFGGDRRASHQHFEDLLRRSFRRIAELQRPDVPITIYYGYKQQSTRGNGRGATAWEALLEAALDAGLMITSTWPLRTERPEGVKKQKNALASSILLVCRPRPNGAAIATASDLRKELRAELPAAVRLLQDAAITPVDLAQAAIGPGMAIFSRYRQILEADGTPMSVKTALHLINETLDQVLSGEAADMDSGTRWALTWFEEHGTNSAPYGQAEQLSKARNVSLDALAAAGVIKLGGGQVRLRSRAEVAEGTFSVAPVWSIALRLTHELETRGEQAAAQLLAEVDAGSAEAARELAYLLFQIAESHGLNQDALAYNGLIASWPELARRAGASTPTLFT